MIKKISFCILLFISYSVYALEADSLCLHKYKNEQLTKYAEFIGGEDAMNSFIYENLKTNCGEDSFNGFITVKFLVNDVGKLLNIKIVESESPCLEDEILKAFKKMPNWMPATINGANVCSEVIIPVRLASIFKYFPRPLCSHMYKNDQLTELAEYVDGPDAMYRFIYKNLNWNCGGDSFEGTVVVGFIVDEAGNLWNIEIEQSVAPCLDKEVVKAFKIMPPWIPANINGGSVCSEISVPVRFRLGWEEKDQRK